MHGVYNTFPFHKLSNWDLLIWLIHWNDNHWLLFLVDKINSSCLLLDPLTGEINEQQTILLNKLIFFVNYISNFNISNASDNKFVYKNINFLPLQTNNYDCGVYCCQYSVDYINYFLSGFKNPLRFNIPNSGQIRSEISSILNSHLSNTLPKNTIKSDESLKPNNVIKYNYSFDLSKEDNLNLIKSKFYENKVQSFNGAIPPVTSPVVIFKNKDESSFLNSLYKSKPKKAIDIILSDTHNVSSPSREDIESYFSSKKLKNIDFGRKTDFPCFKDEISYTDFTISEIDNCFKSLSKSSPGSDGITYSDWKKYDTNFTFLFSLFNNIMKEGKIPDQWRSFKTILILKPGKENESTCISSWRPIAILDTSYRIFAKILNSRLLKWIKNGNLISSCQKGILAQDGCSEHNLIITSALEHVNRFNLNRTKKSELHICYLDLADAFGSVSHELIFFVLEKLGCDPKTIYLLKDMYKDASSYYICGDIKTSPVPIVKGVKQGCPLSMTLFCLTIDFIFRELNFMNLGFNLFDYHISSLAYADDIALLSSSHQNISLLLLSIKEKTDWAGLEFRPQKCGYFNNVENPNYKLFLGEDQIPSVNKDNTYHYLGVPFGSKSKLSLHNLLKETSDSYQKVSESTLSPFQKVNAFKTFYTSRFPFHFRNRVIDIQSLSSKGQQCKGVEKDVGFDQKIIKILKKNVCDAPENLNNFYFFAHPKLGGLGLTKSVDDYMVQNVTHLFRTLTSTDVNIRNACVNELIGNVKARSSNNEINIHDAIDWLHGKDLGASHVQTWFAKIRKSIMDLYKVHKIKIFISFVDSKFEIKISSDYNQNRFGTFYQNNRSNVCQYLHELVGIAYFSKWSLLKAQGRMADTISLSPFSNVSVLKGSISNKSWSFIIKARNNSLPLNYQPYLKKDDPRVGCRRCDFKTEYQSHVLCHCNMDNVGKRHNKLLYFISKFMLDLGYEVITDKPSKEVGSILRPDLVVKKENYPIFLIDIKSPYDLKSNFADARKKNIDHYSELKRLYQVETNLYVVLETLVIGALGSWDPQNDKVLKDIGFTEAQTAKMAISCCRIAIQQSHKIYNDHLKG